MSDIEPVDVRLAGDEANELCRCGCGATHRTLWGEAGRADGSKVLFRALMAACGDRRHLWLGIVSGSADPNDARDSFFTVESWREDEEIRSRVVDPRESPWGNHPALASGVRLWSRAEVKATPGVSEWLFAWTDGLSLRGYPHLGRFVLGTTDA